MSEIIDVIDLRKEFKRNIALKKVSFSVKEGEIFGYLGPNGSGKTTTMRILLGLLKPTSGEARVFGDNLGENPELRKQVGVVLDSRGVYEHLTAYANLEFFCRIYQIKASDRSARIKELMEFADLWDRRDDKVGVFSNGMKQKLAIIRSLLPYPRLLFMDEPTSGLDPEAQNTVRDLILDLKKRGHTIFLNSHDLNEVQTICRRVAILYHGTIIVCDSVENLRDQYSKPIFELDVEDVEKNVIKKINEFDFVVKCSTERNKIILELRDQERFSDILNMLILEGVRVKEARHVSKNLEEVYLNLVREVK